MGDIEFLKDILVPLGAALLGAVAGGVIPAQLQHHREQRYAARTLRAWVRSQRQQLSALLAVIERAPQSRRDSYWRQFTLVPLASDHFAGQLRSLPDWIDGPVLNANIGLDQLSLAVSTNLANGTHDVHGSLAEPAGAVVAVLVYAEEALEHFLKNHSELFGDYGMSVPEAWRAKG